MAAFSSTHEMSPPSVPPDPPDPPPDPPDPPPVSDIPVDDLGPTPNNENLNVSLGGSTESLVATLEPFEVLEFDFKGDELVLKLDCLTLDMNFEEINRKYNKYGNIDEIRISLDSTFKHWCAYVLYESHQVALKAFMKCRKRESCSLISKSKMPLGLEVYHPTCPDETEQPVVSERPSLPPTWLIVTTKSEWGNLYLLRKHLRHKIGNIVNDRITRFGKNSFLVHASSLVQATMILNLKTEQDSMIGKVTPHYNFSYARGVIFNRDLYELEKEEILGMCPLYVTKVFKIPKSSMIILTFHNDYLPHNIVIDSERMEVRPCKLRPLQCFKCFKFGHPSKKCAKEHKLCGRCSLHDHGDCDREEHCINCEGDHSAKYRKCAVYKKEEEAVMKSNNEKISVGYAKKLLNKTSYSEILKNNNSKKDTKGKSIEKSRPSATKPHPSSEKTRTSLEASQALLRATRSSSEATRSSSEATRSSSGTTRSSSGATRSSSEATRSSSEASTSASSEAHVLVSPETTPASQEEAIISDSLPDLETLSDGESPISIETEDLMESEVVRKKRQRTPPPSPPHEHSSDTIKQKSTKIVVKLPSDKTPINKRSKLPSDKTPINKRSKVTITKPSLNRGIENRPK